MVGLFLVAAGVTAVAVPPSLVLGGRPRMLGDEQAADAAVAAGGLDPDGREPTEPERRPLARRPSGPSRPSPVGPVSRSAPSTERGLDRRRRRHPGRRRRRRRSSASRAAPRRSRACPALLREPDASVWVDLAGPSREQVEAVGAALGLHPLIVEDVLEGNQRAKIETTDGVVHIVLFHLDYDAVLVASETGHRARPRVPADGPRRVLGPARRPTTCAAASSRSCKHGPDHLLWALADDIVDGYFPFADRLGDAIDEVQDAVVQQGRHRRSLEQLFFLKRELIDVRRAISPVREVFNQLTNRDTPLIDEDELVYFRDIYDHVIRLTDELDNYRELASATLDVYLTPINNNLSVIMKRLTGVTVILAGHRGGRRDLRDERGGRRARRRRGGRVLGGDGDRGRGRGDRRALPAPDRLDLARGPRRAGVSRRPPASPWGAPTRGRTPPATAAWRRPGACRPSPSGPRTSGARAPPSVAVERVVERLLVPADLGDLVEEPLVVAGPDLDDHAQHLLAVLHLRLLEERQEHPLAGVGVEVRRAALARLAEGARSTSRRCTAGSRSASPAGRPAGRCRARRSGPASRRGRRARVGRGARRGRTERRERDQRDRGRRGRARGRLDRRDGARVGGDRRRVRQQARREERDAERGEHGREQCARIGRRSMGAAS